MSAEINIAIQLLNENKPHHIDVHFEVHAEANRAYICMFDWEPFCCKLRHRDKWDQFIRAIENNTSVRRLNLTKGYGDVSSTEVCECIEALFRVLEFNSSIVELEVDMDLFFNEGELNSINTLFGVQFKERLEYLKLRGGTSDDVISENRSVMFSSVLQDLSLEKFDMRSCEYEEYNDEAFTRMVSACTNVKELKVICSTLSQYAAVTALIEDQSSILNCLDLDESSNGEGLSTLLAGLTGNDTLRELCSPPLMKHICLTEKVLCDTSSIEGIYESNHTLEEINPNDLRVLTPLINELLELNMNPNKEEVFQTKIARYYFVGDFDVTHFANLAISLLPKVLEMIKCNATNRQSAIFRILKSIPELCNVTSRSVGQVGVDVRKVSDSDKRQKISS